jgi:hypothetical protein
MFRAAARPPFCFSAKCYDRIMSPTVFRDGPYRFYFNSREEDRMHVHVESSEGEVKVWLEPRIELAQNQGIAEREVRKILRILEQRHVEIEERWRQHRRR